MSISLEKVALARRVSSESVYSCFTGRVTIERVTYSLARRLSIESTLLRLVGRSGESARDTERACDLSLR